MPEPTANSDAVVLVTGGSGFLGGRAVNKLLQRGVSGADHGETGRKSNYSAERAKELLGWEARPVNETIRNCAESLVARAR